MSVRRADKRERQRMIKAIETRYKGYRFRSRLEARWAVFFDALGVKWEYEKEGFILGDGTMYLPDFWLPEVMMFAEVKPEKFSEEEYGKAASLAVGTRRDVLLLVGVPENKPYTAIVPWEEEEDIAEIDYCLTMYHNYPIDEHRFYCQPGDYSPGGDAFWDDTAVAANAARSARFEHGESG